MAKKKDTPADQPPEEKALEQRVDAMMDPKRPEAPSPAPVPPAPEQPAEATPLDIFQNVGTAPEVAPDLLKKIGLKPDPETGAKKTAKPKTPPPVEAQWVAPREALTTSTPLATSPQPVPTPLPPAANEAIEDDTPLDNPATDKAVDEIVRDEADQLLAVEDASTAPVPPEPPKTSRNWRAIFRRKWWWLVLLLLLIAAALAVPSSRYKLLGLFIHESVTVTVTDAQTHQPVSGAVVNLHGSSVKTNAHGVANFKLAPGPGQLSVTKQYYRSYQTAEALGLHNQSLSIDLQATGRPVPITVVDKISGKPLSGAQINVLDTSATTDVRGEATIVLPPKSATDAATLTLNGYNLANVSVKVTTQSGANNFALVPSGTLYFLSNQSGNIDVVKIALDGSDRHTVVQGTGKEDAQTTSLLASRDWRYLVLEARRDTGQPALYLIDTRTDKLSKIDTANANFQLIGWYGHNFVYDSVSSSLSRWQANREQLRSYNADSDNLSTLDQNQATGSADAYAYQSFENFYLLSDLVVYTTHWYTFGGTDLGGKTASIRGVAPGGQGKKDYQTFDANGVSYIQSALYAPGSIYFGVNNYNTNQTTYYRFANQQVSTANIDQTTLSKTYPTYLFSPDGQQTFWSEVRDGKNALFLGSSSAGSPQQLTTSSDYAPYGWYGNYLLVSKNGSELFVMPAAPLGSNQPLKVSDYYKPAPTYTGYGYGYGGL